MLAMNPDVQEKVVQELREVYDSTDESIDYDSLNKLVYLDLVLKETLRLFPVLPIGARITSGEVQIGKLNMHSLLLYQTNLVQFQAITLFLLVQILWWTRFLYREIKVIGVTMLTNSDPKGLSQRALKRFILMRLFLLVVRNLFAISLNLLNFYCFYPEGGPRLCIGWRYGMLFMKSTLVNFLRNYEVETNLKFKELTFQMTLSMKIVQKNMISLRKRSF